MTSLMCMVDIVILVFNEEKFLKSRKDYFAWLQTKANIIFVDGESTDNTKEVAASYGRVVQSLRGRACQKNAGAQAATKTYLLFLHVDTILNDFAWDNLQKIIKQGHEAACFSLKIDDSFWIFRLFEVLVNVRAKYFRVTDGDLGLLIRKDIFTKLGQFDDVPAMEDILFSRKVRRLEKFCVITSPIIVSARKWHEEGFIKTFLKYSKAYGKYWGMRQAVCLGSLSD